MKRITLVTVLLACGLLAASVPVSAQQAPAPAPASANWFTGEATLLLLGRDNIASSKFEEYRQVPKGPSMPTFSFMGSQDGKDFAVFGQNVSKTDQRYTGWARLPGFGLTFDYNSIPHSMGNDARTIHTEIAEGVWSMNPTLRQALGDAVDAVPAASRIYPFYLALLGPTLATVNSVDITSLRQRGNIEVNLSDSLPFDLRLTYLREAKTGARGASAGDILGVASPVVDVPEPLNEITQDFGIRWTYAFKRGNAHASVNRNIYNDRVSALIIDNPFRATDFVYTTTAAPGGPAAARFSTSPDNEATRGAVGFQLKFPHQTRVAGDVAIGRWTQNDSFLPYTINSVILTPSGARANDVAALQERSLNGKMNTSSYHLSFGSRPVKDLSVRMRYRFYDYKDKTDRWVITGDTSGSPDRSWTAAGTPTAEEPYGHATANRTDASNGRFDAQVGYDLGEVTLEAAYRRLDTEWVGRANSSGTDGTENGYTLSALFHAREWLGFRGSFDQGKRSVSGLVAGSVGALQGVMADHAEREQTRAGVDIELTPSDKFGVTLAYARRSDDYPNRPDKVVGNSATKSGLLEANYDSFTLDFDFTPSERAELVAFYTYEKSNEVNQWVTLTSGALNNLLRYAPRERGDTYGLSGQFKLVPDKWTATLRAQHQKVDGLLDITAREAGAFYTPGRTTVIPAGQGGAADITDYDDTKQTTVVADLAYNVSKDWTFNVGAAYEKFTFADAYSDGTSLFPQAVLFFMKANDGAYTAKIIYTSLNYHW